MCFPIKHFCKICCKSLQIFFTPGWNEVKNIHFVPGWNSRVTPIFLTRAEIENFTPGRNFTCDGALKQLVFWNYELPCATRCFSVTQYRFKKVVILVQFQTRNVWINLGPDSLGSFNLLYRLVWSATSKTVLQLLYNCITTKN